MKAKIAFFDSKPYDIEFFDELNKNYGFEIKYFKNRLSEDTAILAKGYNVVCGFVNDEFNENVLKVLYENGIRLIAMRCAGYNNVDLKYAFNKIHVVRVPAYSPYAVAEHAMGLMLALNRKVHRAYYRTREGNFTLNGLMGFDMHGKTIGIIGTGKIGKVMIKIAKGFGMNILAYDLFPDREYENEIGFSYVELDKLFKESDIISLHCPLTKESYHLINNKNIALMKDGVMIINTGRGKLIDSKALINGLKTKKIGAAGLDVYEEEDQYFFEDVSNEGIQDDVLARLLSFNNVLITSHQAFFTREAVTNIAKTTLDNIKAYIEGKPLENEICYNCDKNKCPKNEKGRCF